jgi:hypothetical protein
MKRILTPILALAGLLLFASPALAQTGQSMWMGGIGGALTGHPAYNTITPAVAGTGCPLVSCTHVTYDNVSVQSGTAAITTWETTNSAGPDYHWMFSESTDSAIKYLDTHPLDPQDTWYLLGSPSTPGYTNNGFFLPATGQYSNVYFVVVAGDLVATGSGTLTTHVHGYDHLDLTHPTTDTIDVLSGAHILYFAKPATTTMKYTPPKAVSTAVELTAVAEPDTSETADQPATSHTARAAHPVREVVTRIHHRAEERQARIGHRRELRTARHDKAAA